MKEGVFVHADNFYLRFLDRKDTLPTIFSFVVPNKVQKTSVGRHLVKRRMTAVVEKVILDAKPGFSVIIFARPNGVSSGRAKKDISKVPFEEVEKEIIELLKKARIF